MAIFGDIWEFYSTFVDIRRHLLIFVDIIQYLSIFVDICWHLSTFFDICRYLSILSISVDKWRYLSIFGDIIRHLSTSVDICRHLLICRYLSTFVVIYRHLSISVDICRFCRYLSINGDICRWLSIFVDEMSINVDQHHFQSYLTIIFQIFGRLLSFSKLYMMKSCTSRLLQKVTLSTTSYDCKAESQLLFQINEPDLPLRNCTKRTFSCVQIAL